MASIVEIQAATTSVTCDEKGNGEHVISIHNTTGRKLRIGARIHVDDPAKAEWIGNPVLQAKPKQQPEPVKVSVTKIPKTKRPETRYISEREGARTEVQHEKMIKDAQDRIDAELKKLQETENRPK